MGYSVKWVTENLGITRDMLRYYEKEKLLSVNESRNQTNKYRDYSDEDIERIWGIKLLIGIGFTAKEIYALMNNPNFDFETVIAKKVAELEHENWNFYDDPRSAPFMQMADTLIFQRPCKSSVLMMWSAFLKCSKNSVLKE